MLPAIPKKLPIDQIRIETAKGHWGIFVEHLAETHAGRNLLVRIILDQSIDEEHFRTRTLEIILRSQEARDPNRAAEIAVRIREWIENTEGDGFIDSTLI